MAFYNDGSFQSILSIITILGLGIVFLCFISKIIYALFCFDIRKIYNENINDNNDNQISITQINNPFQESIVISIQPQHTTDDDNDDDIPTAIIQINNQFEESTVITMQPKTTIDTDDIPIAEQV
jgi:hypothetical protein